MRPVRHRRSTTMRRLAWLGLAVAILGTLSLSACQGPRPDLHRLYTLEMQGQRPASTPVIVIPGILGSRLRDRDTHTDIWPPLTVWSLLFDRQRQLELRFDPRTLEVLPDNVEAYDLFEGAYNVDFYGAILRTLADSGGYVRGIPGTPVPSGAEQRRYYVFAYDWRQDAVVTVRKLDALIEQIRRDYGDPALTVDVVAHSMGGLITRYYQRYGTADVLDDGAVPPATGAAAKLHTVVLLGTPNLGAVSSVHRLQDGWTLGLRRISAETLATLPSIYQLFPHPLNTAVVHADGTPADIDLFDPEVWRREQWSVFAPAMQASLARSGDDLAALQRYFVKRLERARRFVWSLSVPAPETPVKLVVFGGDCVLTPSRLVLEGSGGHQRLREFPSEVSNPLPGVDYTRVMLEPGDGTVTRTSLLARQERNPVEDGGDGGFFPLAYSVFLCENHERLTGNINFQDNLLNVLLTRVRPWDQPQRMAESPLPMTVPLRQPPQPGLGPH